MPECELCGDETDETVTTDDSHPYGPGLMVCPPCSETGPLRVTQDGLRLPKYLREFEGQVVFRTPRGTVQHFGSTPLDGYYGMVRPRDFGTAEEFRDAQNPSLAPDRVSIKKQGEDTLTFQITEETA